MLAARAGGSVTAQEVLGGTEVVRGAGSSFAYPVISRWAHTYQRWLALGGDFPFFNSGLDDPQVGPPLDYEPVGSLAGTLRVRDRAVDFGASDVPLPSDELAKLGLGQFPIVIGGVRGGRQCRRRRPQRDQAHRHGARRHLPRQDQEWSHPAIKALNPGLKLPDAPIAVVHRSDGSGTTYNLAHFLTRSKPGVAREDGRQDTAAVAIGHRRQGQRGRRASGAQRPRTRSATSNTRRRPSSSSRRR